MGIRELAKVLKLSVSTVSRALNDSDGVGAETRERVRAAALEHGYAPGKSAASLRRGRLDTIYVRPNTLLAIGTEDQRPDYDYASRSELHLFELADGASAARA
ncbi:hypothetical protein LMG27952_05557 [Paraburkholderia hiiakae]|uniref:HTH lacI-type domain-containing protein n=1 Tax=Paraburkholderia hiiakae TaxID=1081782 RepID=A0ABN7I9F5_9BURK|nr:LacI family DNA-binding transcriptional regulator [Paraburkholderia hiiakae]CAD6554163.1 hypothetical protein LMG27952_05557 [Paraburkholderia hiiakae]